MSTDLANDVYDDIATMVARSWRTLGVPLSARPTHSTIVDPEALILLTAWLTGERDARVHSAALSWSIQHHALVNAVRLDNMADSLPLEMASEFEPFAATVNESVSHGKWRRGTADDLIPYGVPESKPLQPLDPANPALLRIRLRSLAGANARSEALAVLLASPTVQFTTAAVARDAYVAQRHARVALDALAVGGWVDRWQLQRENRYRVSHQSTIAFADSPTWISWGDRVRALYTLLESARALDPAKPMDSVATVMELVSAQSEAFRDSMISIPDWRNADTPDGLARTADWIRASSARLVELV